MVPTCLWEFLARHTNIGAIWKRNQKGFLFTIGDRVDIYSKPVGAMIERVIGDTPSGEVTRESILKEAEASFHVFHIMIGGENERNAEFLSGYRTALDRESTACLPEIIINTIQLQKGKAREDVLLRWDELNRPFISAALAQLSLQADADVQL